MGRRSVTERGIQAGMIAWRNRQVNVYPELRWLHAVPNGELRDPIIAKILKGQGVVPGIWDLFWPLVRPPYHGLYLETKKPGGSLSKEQREFRDYATEQGYCLRVYTDIAEGIEICRWYMGLKGGNCGHTGISKAPA